MSPEKELVPELPPPSQAVEIDPCGTPKNGRNERGPFCWVGFDKITGTIWGKPFKTTKTKI